MWSVFILLLITLQCLLLAQNYFRFWKQNKKQSQVPYFVDLIFYYGQKRWMQLPSLKCTLLHSSFQRPQCGQVAESKFKVEKADRRHPSRWPSRPWKNLTKPRVRTGGGWPGPSVLLRRYRASTQHHDNRTWHHDNTSPTGNAVGEPCRQQMCDQNLPSHTGFIC